MQSMKFMFLGFLVMLVGLAYLFSLGTALPGDGTRTINPVVEVFYSGSSCVNTSDQGFTCIGDTDPAGQLSEIVRGQETYAFLLILIGLGIAVVGYFREEPPARKPPTSVAPPPQAKSE